MTCASCCLEFFWGGWSSHDPGQGIHGHPDNGYTFMIIYESLSYPTIWNQLELGLNGNRSQCNHTSNRFNLTIPHQQVLMRFVCQSYLLPLGGIQELQCLVSSELISLCPAVVDTLSNQVIKLHQRRKHELSGLEDPWRFVIFGKASPGIRPVLVALQ